MQIRDSYFVIKGLLLSDQVEMAKNMIENFFDFVERYGFIRKYSAYNDRLYYTKKSHSLVQLTVLVFTT